VPFGGSGSNEAVGGGVAGTGPRQCSPSEDLQPPPASALGPSALGPSAIAEESPQQQLERALAVVALARTCTDGSAAARGVSFTTVEALALHVKALDLMQRCMLAQQQQQPQLLALAGAAVDPTSLPPHFEALRESFGELLLNAERIREQLRAEGCSAGQERASPTVCVEELLYRHALSMGREAAIDELLGKLHTSCSLYQQAKLLLEQLAHEPQVGSADRSVLSKYAAGFAWRLHEIAAKHAAAEART